MTDQNPDTPDTPGQDTPEEEKRLRTMRERFDKVLEIYGNFTDKYEKEEPDWIILTAFHLVRNSLYSLRQYIKNPDPLFPDISWENPWVELQYPVEWNWRHEERQGGALFGQFTEEELKDKDTITKKLVEMFFKQKELFVLGLLTDQAALGKRGNKYQALLPLDMIEELDKLPEDERKARLDELYKPNYFGTVNEESPLMEEGETEGGGKPLPSLRFNPKDEEGRLIFDCHISVEFHPLVVDEDERRAYFPVVVGLTFIPSEENPYPDPSTWTQELQEMFWDTLDKGVGQAIDGLSRYGKPKEETLPLTETPAKEETETFNRETVYFSVDGEGTSALPAPIVVSPPKTRPYYGVVSKNALVDMKTVKPYLDASLKSRGLFGKWSNLASLEEEASKLSQEILDAEGEDDWKKAGGYKENKTGKLSLRQDSPRRGDLMISLAHRNRGFIWFDPSITPPTEQACWLLRTGDGNYLGFGLSWHGQAGPYYDQFREWVRKRVQALSKEPPSLFPEDRAQKEKEMDVLTQSLSVWSRGTQLLWLLHDHVWQQSSSYVVIPDVTIGQALWGGDDTKWPDHWHREIESGLDSLILMDWRTWIITKEGSVHREGHWKPVAGYKTPNHPEPEHRAPKECPENCPLKNHDISHGHYIVGLSPNFVGVLDAWAISRKKRQAVAATDKSPDEILYGWHSKRLEKEERKALQGNRGFARKDLLPGVMLTASWSGLTSSQKRLLLCLLDELTLAPERKGKHVTERTDLARIYEGGKPLRIDSKTKLDCLLLEKGKRYVCFGGNGKRPGGGYRIGGTPSKETPGVRGSRRGGWLHRAEYYEVRPGPGGSHAAVKSFLKDLRGVMDLLGGVAVGNLKGAWLPLEDMERLAARRNIKDLLKVNVRPFGAEDYQERMEEYAREKGGFSDIPRSQAELDLAVLKEVEERGGITREKLKIELARRGIKQKDFAARLGITPAFLSYVLTGVKPFPEDLRKKARSLLEEGELTKI